MSAAITTPNPETVARAESYLRGTIDQADRDHAIVVIAILDELTRRGLYIDANGSFRSDIGNSTIDADHGTIGREIAFRIRSGGAKVDSARVTESLEVMAGADAKKRRQKIYDEHLGKPSSAAGEVELRRWIEAITGAEREADVQAIRHWLWQVKNRVASRHGEQHLMPVIFGLKQGSGKSVAVAKLCSPWCELFNPDFKMEDITDDRSAATLARTVIGLWDELGGLGRTDVEKLKHRLTGSVVRYRPMRTNSETEAPMLTSLIGTSNRRLVDLARDPTGARRFYEIEAQDCIDWKAINEINYTLLWESVNEDEKAPGIVYKAIIQAEQTKLVWSDPIERWLLDEEDAGWSVVSGVDGQDLGSVRPDQGAATTRLYGRFRRWCEDNGEREVTAAIVGRRLTELGWEPFRLSRANGQAPAYRRRLIEKPTLHTLHNPAQSPDSAPSVHGVHGVQGDLLYEPVVVFGDL